MEEIKGIVNLKKNEGRTVNAGGLWVYDNEIESTAGSFADGDLVIVKANNGFALGVGFINRRSKITVRLLTRNPDEAIDEAFLKSASETAGNTEKRLWTHRHAGLFSAKPTCFRGL